MSNDNCVTKLIQKTDIGVRITVFNNTQTAANPKGGPMKTGYKASKAA